MDAFVWTKELVEKLIAEFGGRIAFVGLQGSRARGEAHEGSDIDVVVLLDAVTADDLARYRTLVESMPQSELACGFVGSVLVLAAWPRHELFQFYNDTVPVYGKLPDITPFTERDAMESARIGAAGIYHAACHALVFDFDIAEGILKSLFKSAFFTLQALQFARTGKYSHTKTELAKFLEGDEARILEINRDWDAYRPSGEAEMGKLVDLILGWAEGVIRPAHNGRATDASLEPFLQSTEFIDFDDKAVAEVARTLKMQAQDTISLIKATFEYVRDEIAHSYDAQLHVPAAKASEVLLAGGSICWGKANLLAALLRANGVPSGISYQILTKGDTPDSGYMVHALNTVYVDGEHGWIRLDARGNKEGVDARFSLDEERLAYVVRPEYGEQDLHDNHPDADSDLMKLIRESGDILAVSSEAVLNRFR